MAKKGKIQGQQSTSGLLSSMLQNMGYNTGSGNVSMSAAPTGAAAYQRPPLTIGANGETIVGYTGGDAITNQLVNALMNPSSGVDLQEMAHNLYSSYYDQLSLAAQQAYDTHALALEQQKTNLGRNYDRQRQEAANNYAQAVSQADRRATQRGMGRSSYNMQTLANLDQAGVEAQNELWRMQGEDEGNLDAQITQAAQQLAQQLQHYTQNQASDELGYVQQQQLQNAQTANQNAQYLLNYFTGIDQFNQQMNQNNMQFLINAMQNQQQIDNQASQYQQTFNAQYGGQGSSGSSSSTYNPGPKPTPDPGNPNPGPTAQELIDDIDGYNNQQPAASHTGGATPFTTSNPNKPTLAKSLRRRL